MGPGVAWRCEANRSLSQTPRLESYFIHSYVYTEVPEASFLPYLICSKPSPPSVKGSLIQPYCSAHPPPYMEFFQVSNLLLQHSLLPRGAAFTPCRLNLTSAWAFLGVECPLHSSRSQKRLWTGVRGWGYWCLCLRFCAAI